MVPFSGPITDIGWVGGTYTAVTDIPFRAWALCDGSSFTVPGIGAMSVPDHRNRFIVGAGNTFNEGDTGGSNSANIGSHDHGGSTGSYVLQPDDLPPLSGDSGSQQAEVLGGTPDLNTSRGGGTTGTGFENISVTVNGSSPQDPISLGIPGYAGHDNKPLYLASAVIAFVGYLHS
jgi:hypothetical protein